MSSTEPPVAPGAKPACFLCGRPTFDPDKGAVPWARAVADRGQVLVCPTCQAERPEWVEAVDRCERCGGTRLSALLGRIACRACGHVRPVEHTGPGA